MTAKNGPGRRPAWVRLNFHHWESLRLRLAPDEVHAYISLFCESAYYGGRLALPVDAIARRARVDAATLAGLVSDHPELFELDGDSLVVLHAAEEVAHALDVAKQRAAAGRRSGEVRRLRIVDGGGSGNG